MLVPDIVLYGPPIASETSQDEYTSTPGPAMSGPFTPEAPGRNRLEKPAVAIILSSAATVKTDGELPGCPTAPS